MTSTWNRETYPDGQCAVLNKCLYHFLYISKPDPISSCISKRPPMLPRSSPAILRASTRLSQLQTQVVPSSSSSTISNPGPGPRRMASQATKFKLNTGAEIPAIGFGTWQDKDSQEDAVLAAIQAGYRHIDGARMYVTPEGLSVNETWRY